MSTLSECYVKTALKLFWKFYAERIPANTQMKVMTVFNRKLFFHLIAHSNVNFHSIKYSLPNLISKLTFICQKIRMNLFICTKDHMKTPRTTNHIHNFANYKIYINLQKYFIQICIFNLKRRLFGYFSE